MVTGWRGSIHHNDYYFILLVNVEKQCIPFYIECHFGSNVHGRHIVN